MRFKKWLENLELTSLRSHLKNPTLDVASLGWDFIAWKGSKKLMTRLKIDPAAFRQSMEDGEEDFYTMSDQIGKGMTPEEAEGFFYYMNTHNPGDVPSHSMMDLQKNRGRKGYLPPTTWLIHFSDRAGDVADNGFTQGQSDINRLALTTHQSDKEKSYGGYNFAFTADGRHAYQAARSGKYGKDAVVFQAAGIPVYHHSDEEDQVVFWGKDVPTTGMVSIVSDGGEWTVRARRGKRDELFKGDFKVCVGWVMKNYNQYRRVL